MDIIMDNINKKNTRLWKYPSKERTTGSSTAGLRIIKVVAIRPSAQIHWDLNTRNAFLMGGDLNARTLIIINILVMSEDTFFEDIHAVFLF